jgi:hypothetical protein
MLKDILILLECLTTISACSILSKFNKWKKPKRRRLMEEHNYQPIKLVFKKEL